MLFYQIYRSLLFLSSVFLLCVYGGDVFASEDIHVIAKRLDQGRNNLQPSLGASQTHFSHEALESIIGGENSSLNSILLQAPGVSQDSYGQVHIRGDHNNVQYRLNGVALPEGISVFGQTLMSRFVSDMSLTTGAVPAQYGFRQAGIIDLHLKNGTNNAGGEVSVYGGARDYFFPSFEYGLSKGKWDGFFVGDFVHNRVGIENTTDHFNALHDLTNQYHFLGHIRYLLRPETRLSLMMGVSNGWYQLPNNPGVQHQFATPLFKKDSASMANTQEIKSDSLDEHQQEITDFAILSWEEMHSKINAQTSLIVRYSSLRYSPDWYGDLVYNGLAQQAARSVFSVGLQNDTLFKQIKNHKIRAGYQAVIERNSTKTSSLVYSETGGGFSSSPINIDDGSGKTGGYYGVYLQDEWKLASWAILNMGLRYDGVDEYTKSHQLSPRISFVVRPWRSAHFHIGYARYFTPPPFESVSGESFSKFIGTSAAPTNLENHSVKSERSHYIDVGLTQDLNPHWHVTIDAYWKYAHNLLDEGQFGAPIILTAYNYRRGKVHGYEFSSDYEKGPWMIYGSFAWSRALGRDVSSSEWNFDEEDLSYMRNHWVHLDHDQRWTASLGTSYRFFDKKPYMLRWSLDMVYGSGLRKDGAVPNGASVPSYVTFNMGLVQNIQLLKQHLSARLDVINLFDKQYLLRDGSGVGVGAPQYGLRRTILAGISFKI